MRAQATFPASSLSLTDPDQSQERLAAGIIFPHPAMPEVSFTNSELRDVISYIMSLRVKN
jgi:hypothetical protein